MTTWCVATVADYNALSADAKFYLNENIRQDSFDTCRKNLAGTEFVSCCINQGDNECILTAISVSMDMYNDTTIAELMATPEWQEEE